MAIQRRCLVTGCSCAGYARDMETYDPGDEEFVGVETGESGLLCARCGHREEQHELAAWDG
jgi:hypothetical protein